MVGFPLRAARWVTTLVVLGGSSWTLATTANAVLAAELRVVPSLNGVQARPHGRSENRLAEPQSDFVAIAARNLLGARRENLEPAPSPDEASGFTEASAAYDESDLEDCTMSADLRGTIVAAANPEWSTAVFYNRNARRSELHSTLDGEDEITVDTTLVDIREGAVVVHRDDHFELCKADAPSRRRRAPSRLSRRAKNNHIKRLSAGRYRVDREYIDETLSNLSKVATKARIVPSYRNGEPNGFKIYRIKPRSLYADLGLKNGDVIKKINGRTLDTPKRALELYQNLRQSELTAVVIDIQRRGHSQTFQYTIR